MIITSTANPQIKAIRKLRDRKERRQSGLFYIEGLRIVGEAVEQQAEIETLIVAPDLLISDFGRNLVETCRHNKTNLLEVSAEVFQHLALKEGPQGLAAVLRQNFAPLETITLRPNNLWVALDSVADPGNLGTIMRTLDAVGGCGIILLDDSTDPYDTNATRASMGAVFNLKLVKASFAAFADWKRKNKVPLIGTSDAAKTDYHYVTYPPAFVLLMGSERHGLPQQHINLCDYMLAIPMLGKSDSLNLAVSTAVVLYEVFNHRRDGNG